jgi:hypothetical protein
VGRVRRGLPRAIDRDRAAQPRSAFVLTPPTRTCWPAGSGRPIR